MAYRVEITPQALAQIDRATAWIAADSPRAAMRWFNGLMEALHSLETLPRRCRLAPENDALDVEIRQLLYDNKRYAYRILFTVVDRVVYVLHVCHAARRPVGPEPSDS